MPGPSGATLHPRDLREAVFAEAEERFGRFIRERVNPGARERDRTGLPLSRELLREATAIGLANYHAPAGAGGGRSSAEWGLLLEWVGYECDDLALPVLLGYRQTLCNLLHELGDPGELGAGSSGARPHLRERFAEPLVTGTRSMSVAYTEGADPFSFRSSARKVDGGYVIDAHKSMISGAMTADWILTFVAGKERDLIAVVVDASDPGINLTARDLMGMRSLGVASMDVEDVFVPDDDVVVARDGLTCAQQFFNARRLNAPCSAVGRVQRLFESTAVDLSRRVRYRLPVAEMQSVQARLGQAYVAIETARTVLYDALWRAERGMCDPVWDPAITVSKYFVVEQAASVAHSLAYVLGGAAYDRANPYERAVRDIQALIHIAGTQATLETDLGIRAIGEVVQGLARFIID